MSKLRAKVFRKDSGFSPSERGKDRVLTIVRAAFDALYEDGFERTSFETVGARCRMRRSHIAYYFKRREDLLEAVFRYIAQEAQEVVVTHIVRAKTPKEQIQALIVGHFDWAERAPKQVLVMMLFYFQAMRDERFAAMHQGIRDIGAQRIRAVLQLGTGASPKDAMGPAKNIQALITGNIIDHFSTGGVISLKKEMEYTLAAVNGLYEELRKTARAKSRIIRVKRGEPNETSNVSANAPVPNHVAAP